MLNYKEMQEAIGDKVRLGGDTLEIAGIIDDYHQMSLKNDKAPLVFRLSTSNEFFAYKIDSKNYQKILNQSGRNFFRETHSTISFWMIFQ